jgi:hypothetical protein
MIAQVDDALCRFIGRHLPAGTAVRLDAPKPAWQTESQHQTVDLFLFGLRDAGAVGAAQPVRRCVQSYLVTACASKVQDEHRLLDLALCTMLRTETLPADLLPEDAVVNDVPISLSIADTDPTGLWTSLGMPARAGFVATVTAPMSASGLGH